MDVGFTGEQQLLADTMETMARRMAPATTHEIDPRACREAWRQLTDAGLVGIHLPEALGGGGGSTVELLIVVEQLARHLVAVPFLGATLGAQLLLAAGAPDELVAGLANGTRRYPIALRGDLRTPARLGEPDAVVWDGAGADGAVVVDEQGRLYLVAVDGDPVDGADLTRHLIRLPAEPTLVYPDPIGDPPTKDQWSRWEALALALLCADLVGTMEGALQAAVAYSRERVQFGTRIGAFQAVQHLCADAHVLTEAARSATWYACWGVDHLAPDTALLAARAAKAYASDSAPQVLEAVIQVHGGIAITYETLPHVHLRRGLLSRRSLGDETVQIDLIAAARPGAAA
jgi:alkylation response protein AidB-like acyl-CoA dehydrogenase